MIRKNSLILYRIGNKNFLTKCCFPPKYAPPVIGPNNVFGGNSAKIKKFHKGK